MAGGKDVAEALVPIRRPLLVEWRHFRGDDGLPLVDFLPQHLPDQPLAVAVSVRQGRIEEGHALIERGPKRVAALTIVDPEPHLAAEPPPTEANLADVVPGRA